MRYLQLLVFSFLLLACQIQEQNGERLFEQGRFDEAITFYSNHLDANGFDVEIMYNRGRAYEESGDIEAAQEDYLTVLSKDEKHLNARLSLAKLAYENGDYSRSLLLTGEVLKHHENSSQAYFLLARARHQLGYQQSAMEAYNAAISLNKNYGEAYLYRGALKTSMKIKTACEDLKTAERMGVEGGSEAVGKYCS